jgi:hypothetical protein
MTKRYDFHLDKPLINEVLLVGDKKLKNFRIEYKLIAGSHIEIVDGGTKEKPDPKHPVINVINAQPDGWDTENTFSSSGEEAEPPSLKIEVDPNESKTKLVLENFYVYEAGDSYFNESIVPGEDGVWSITCEGSISISGDNENRQQKISFSGTIIAIWIPDPLPGGIYYHDEWLVGDGSKKNPIKLNLEKIAEYIKNKLKS